MNVTRLARTLAAAALIACGGGPARSSGTPWQFEPIASIGTRGTEAGQFEYVEDLALTRDGRILATDAAHAWVQAFDKTTGRFLGRFGGRGDEDHHLERPEGIAVDEAGNVFVADHASGFIKKYDPAFRWLVTFGGYGAGAGQTMRSEFMDIHGGRLFVPEAGTHRVSVFDLDGAHVRAFGRRGAGPGEFDSPEAAKVSPDGRLFVTDLRNDRLQVFDPEGRLLAVWGRTGTGPGEFRSPAGLGFDRDGNVYVSEIGNSRVQVLGPDGRFLGMWGVPGSAPGAFSNLHGVLVDRDTGLVYVADTGNFRIQVFRRVGAPSH
ncbi:NHL repeat containing protein [Methylobacterium sp. 4-46]|uniref:NHL repeat-containing protein n=1 Tax=unclassified Methylobacterium TaxID=2615210 RepID=UPI000152D6E6|nr:MULTISPECIES: NHL repeat-containing protein [Methylobacterium]ACA15895.1 NHL repeat containing protein [Methylobacterium sp. 4-46]WFT81613.1 NHL repeat-containing protein [Methylobacterium nodulans]